MPNGKKVSAIEKHLLSLLSLFLFPGNLYAVGGCDQNNFRLNSVECYSPSTDTWSFTAPMSTCRSSPCVLTCNRHLYVIGGVNYVGMSLNTGECFNPLTNTWSAIAPMHDKRASAGGAGCNGKIYVIGEALGVFFNPSLPKANLTKPRELLNPELSSKT